MRRNLLIILLLTAPALMLSAQNRLPQEYTSPDEIITLSADMTFEQAFEILSKISNKKEGRIIIDPLRHQGRIDVDIINLPWKRALDVILKAHHLRYAVHEKFYEVTGEPQQIDADKAPITSVSREIRIEAVFFEGDRHALSEAGIDWSVLREGSKLTSGFEVNGATSTSSNLVEGSVNYTNKVGNADLTLTGLLRAYESQNLGRILAQPEIVVLSGKEGRIQVGQDFSIKTRDFAGNIMDQFYSTGTILTVSPVTISDNGLNFIHLTIHAERSNAIPDVVSTTINKSQADTQVLLLNGESTMVGGLFSRDYKTVHKGVPYLKDLPWWVFGLRYVFGYHLKEGTDKELLVVLRATLLPELKTRNAEPLKFKNDVFEQGRDDKRKSMEEDWQKTEGREVGR
jgi:type IV pilus assembly protein PilQ